MEREFHRWLKKQAAPAQACDSGSSVSAGSDTGVKLGIGDDAAVIRSFGESGFVVSTDTIADGTHFTIGEHSLQRIGRKGLAVNLSDLAAMGAIPTAALLTLMLPRKFTIDDAKQLFYGFQDLAAEFDVSIIGGDTNRWDGALVVGATIIGREYSEPGITGSTPRIWRLDTARPGDNIFVSGRFGGSILGRHLDFRPRVRLAQQLIRNFEVNAATDASDSLSLDLAAVATASGVGVELETGSIPIAAAAAELSQRDGISPVRHALTDGEDFELILAVPPSETSRLIETFSGQNELTMIGQFVSEQGFWLVDSQGRREPMDPAGYSH